MNVIESVSEKIVLIVILLAVGSIAATAFKAFVLPRLIGKIGEARVNALLKMDLDPHTYLLIPNVTLPAGGATTQVDHVIVSRYGVFVLETKSLTGLIYGDAGRSRWIQVNYRRKYKFQNPLRQNYKHVKTLAELTGIPENFFLSVVVFAGDSVFKTDMPPNVVSIPHLVTYIRSRTERLIKDDQVQEVASAIRAWAGTVSKELRRKHVANLRKNREPVYAKAEPPTCHRRASLMELRYDRRGRRYWGCAKFPD